MSLIARHLEANGIATVIIGSARDIVEIAGVPRFAFVDYPLGNPTGKPGDASEQHTITGAALDLLTAANGPRTTQQLDYAWGSDEWRDVYMHVGPDNAADLAEAGRRRREEQAAKRAAKTTS